MMMTSPHKHAVFGNFEQCLRLYGKLEPIVEEEGVARYVSGVPYALFNGLYCPGFQKVSLTEGHLAFLRDRGLPFTCWLDSECDSQPLLTVGCQDPGVYTGVALDREDFPTDFSFPPNITVVEVDSPDLFGAWSELLGEAFGLPEAIAKPWAEFNEPFGPGTPLTHYLGYLEGKAVGTLSILQSGEIGGLYNGTVLPQARRQGVAMSMGLTALERIGQQESTVAISLLMAEKKASRLCEKLGFQEVCHLTPYLYGSAPEDLEPGI